MSNSKGSSQTSFQSAENAILDHSNYDSFEHLASAHDGLMGIIYHYYKKKEISGRPTLFGNIVMGHVIEWIDDPDLNSVETHMFPGTDKEVVKIPKKFFNFKNELDRINQEIAILSSFDKAKKAAIILAVETLVVMIGPSKIPDVVKSYQENNMQDENNEEKESLKKK